MENSVTACVVVIDDELELLELVNDVLEMAGFQVVKVNRSALLHSAVESVRPDLFLIDIMLAGTSGIELAQQLRAQGFRDTPMIAMSAARVVARAAARSGMFQSTVDKPFDIAALLDHISSLLGRVEQYAS